jgi:hypothetical protein
VNVLVTVRTRGAARRQNNDGIQVSKLAGGRRKDKLEARRHSDLQLADTCRKASSFVAVNRSLGLKFSC